MRASIAPCSSKCFNEAGADCPGMPGPPSRESCARSGFNEAGADCPGMQAQEKANDNAEPASMRPGQTAPECSGGSSPSLDVLAELQ